MEGCPRKEPKTKTRKLCEAAGVSKPAFCYNKGNGSQELKEILGLPLRLPKQVLKRRGGRAKTREIKIRFGKTVNHKRAARICRENGLLAKNRRLDENQKNLPKNVLNRDFKGEEPLRKLCTESRISGLRRAGST